MGLMVKHGLYPPQIPADRQMCWEHCPQSDPDSSYLHKRNSSPGTRISCTEEVLDLFSLAVSSDF